VDRVLVLLPVACVLVVLSIRAARHWGPGIHLATRFLNVMGLALVVMSLPRIVTFNVLRAVRPARRVAEAPQGTQAASFGPQRDVIYIILDRYASGTTLARDFGYDNSGFLDFLTERGFYVAHDSHANYLKTTHSLASSLNMSYLGDVASEVGGASDDWTPLYTRIEDNALWRSLSRRGYRMLHVGSWWGPTRENRYATMGPERVAVPYFDRLCLMSTLFYALDRHFGYFDDLVEPRRIQWNQFHRQMQVLEHLPRDGGPWFVFAHVLVPHPPYVFDRGGHFVTKNTEEEGGLARGYVEQLDYLNREMREVVDSLLAKRSVAPIVVIQSDEGPYPKRYQNHVMQFDWRRASEPELQHKMGILSAFYLPDGGAADLYPSITPVNSFRVILNRYFGTRLERLPDRSYAFTDERHPYAFFDITASLGAPAVHLAAATQP